MSRPVPLSYQRHAQTHWQRFSDYRHAAHLHLIPLSAPEVSRVASQLPIVFAMANQQPSLCVLTGLEQDVNHCLNSKHQWQTDYVPAYLRSHPFVIAAAPDKSGQSVLCIDQDSPWIGDQGEAIFDDNQQPTTTVQEILTFLKETTRHYQRTQKAVNLLNDYQLLTPWPITDHRGQAIGGIKRINEQTLNALSADQLQHLQKSGALAIAYAQLISTHQLPALQQRAGHHTPPITDQTLDLDALFGGGDILKFN